MKKELVITGDGSHTIYLPEMDEHYHSTHGAIRESVHIYINQGLLQFANREISILEIGFGTGLNAWLTAIFSEKYNIKVRYLSIEKYPLVQSEYSKLNYTEKEFSEYDGIFEKLHRAGWNTDVKISPRFTLHKIHADLETANLNLDEKVDLIYYDAFAPNKQPELWAGPVIEKVSACAGAGAVVVTYCAKGSVRRAFAANGFRMERLPGPPGKKEIIRGKKLG